MDNREESLSLRDRWSCVKGEIPRLRKSQTLDLRRSDQSEPPRKVLRKRLSLSSFESDDVKSAKLERQSAHNLRLPSFNLLGIGNPHSQQPGLHLAATQLGEHAITRGQFALNTYDPSSLTFRQHLQSTYGASSLLTPPDDESPSWTRQPIETPALNKDFFSSKPKSHSMTTPSEPADGATKPNSDSFGASGSKSGSPKSPDQYLGNDNTSMNPGLDEAMQITVATLAASSTQDNAIRIVAQTLPSPAAETSKIPQGLRSSNVNTCPHKRPGTFTSIFPTALDAIQSILPTIQANYIAITHAVPSKFSLSNLPTSPPTTPNIAAANEYFSATVFRNAVPIDSYQDLLRMSETMHVPMTSSPRPAVPPETVHISLMERYLPPTSHQEHRDLFSPSGASALMDRLAELSPNGGTLLFVYPTRVGARTFTHDYLGPILDPLLRQMIIINELSTSLGSALGKMAAADYMATYDEMKRKIQNLCVHLNRNPSMPSAKSRFSIVYSNKGYATLAREVWTQWWAHQETPRAKEVLSAYWRNGQRLPANKEKTSAALLREMVEGVQKRPYDAETEPGVGVEVGIFVIRRS
ncbi:MAG: hypothetical protein M1834_007167 [Cirrosporium novae-zelandiae]|nr:MAG: hypothetical protein M1834_007167 [Cirrosporium novae-zelandiae]